MEGRDLIDEVNAYFGPSRVVGNYYGGFGGPTATPEPVLQLAEGGHHWEARGAYRRQKTPEQSHD